MVNIVRTRKCKGLDKKKECESEDYEWICWKTNVLV